MPIAFLDTSTHLIRFAFHRISNNPPSIFNPPLFLHHMLLLSHPGSKCIKLIEPFLPQHYRNTSPFITSAPNVHHPSTSPAALSRQKRLAHYNMNPVALRTHGVGRTDCITLSSILFVTGLLDGFLLERHVIRTGM